MNAANRRAANRVRQRRLYARRRRNAACATVEFDGRILARLITAGWLPEREVLPPEVVAAAIADMLDPTAQTATRRASGRLRRRKWAARRRARRSAPSR